jgi:hypothetical protein
MQVVIPSRVQILLLGLRIWVWFLMQLNNLANLMLRLIIIGIPNSVMPNITPDIPIRVIKAVNENGFDITKKLNMFMNYKWDPDMCDDGGVDLDSFCEWIGSGIIWISYILECDISNDNCDKLLTLIKKLEPNEELQSPIEIDTLSKFKKHLQILVVDTSKKVIYKLKNTSSKLNEESVLFGEISFT